MNDVNDIGLDALAPTVDAAQAHALFDARRGRRRARRRLLVATSTVACLGLLGVCAWAVARDRDDRVVSVDTGLANQPTATESEPERAFDVLALAGSNLPDGGLQAAIDDETYRQLWTSAGLDGDAPVVDFDRSVVVFLTMPDDACPPALGGFALDETTRVISPQFVESDLGCIAVGTTWTYVVSLDRALVGPLLTVRLPAAASPSHYAGQPSITLLTGATAPPGLVPPPCVESGGALVCINNPGTVGTVELRATYLQPGSSLAVTLPDGRTEQYGTGQELIGFFGAPTRGTILILHVAGITAAGNPIEGTIGIAG